MNELLNRIFGLGSGEHTLGFGSADAELSFVHALPAWVIALVLCTIVFGVWWSYRALPGGRWARGAMGVMRALALAILFVLALGPMIEQTTIRTEQDWVMVLLDRSQSMNTRDAPGNGSTFVTRNDQLANMLKDAGEQWDALAAEKHVLWIGFGDRASAIGVGAVPNDDTMPKPISQSTNLASAIRGALDEAAARPISSVVIVSDGRSFDTVDTELINRLKGAQIPVFTVALGSDEPVRDLGIARVEYPRSVFADDLVPIRVLMSSAGLTRDELGGDQLRVDLIDHATGEVVDSSPIDSSHLEQEEGEQAQWVTLSYTPDSIGEREYDLVIASSTMQTIDLNASNNQSSIRMRVVDRPMRVLYIDGYPRWEHRYLKNLLLRERSITSSSMLLASSRRYVQEGDELIAMLPTTVEEWEPFDVVILGDVRPQLFSDQQLDSLLEHVTTHGAGVLWIAGPSSTPSAWLDSPLSALLPMHRDAGGSQGAVHAWESPVTMRSTSEADRIGVLGLNDERTGWFDRLSDPSTGWSKLQWALNLDATSFKPGVSVLAKARSATDQQESPIITMMRYGAGRSIFVGTDEIWRWRYGRGEDLPERFWLPIIRTLGRGTVDRRAASADLRISPTHPMPGKPALITLRLFNQAHIDTLPDEIRVHIQSTSAIDEPNTVVLRGTGDTRIGTWIPDQPGAYRASLAGMDIELSQIVTNTRVLDGSDEQRTLDADHKLLARLAEHTGGQILKANAFHTIPDLMPNRTRTIASSPKQASLWDRPIVLVVLILLLGAEWIGRRILRLA